jgi:hypothetical protein
MSGAPVAPDPALVYCAFCAFSVAGGPSRVASVTMNLIRLAKWPIM